MSKPNPEALAFRARLDAWRAKPEEQQHAYFRARTPGVLTRTLAVVAGCPHRGGVLPLSQQPQHCAKCSEVSGCSAGFGRIPGRVTLRECTTCSVTLATLAAQGIAPPPPTPQS